MDHDTATLAEALEESKRIVTWDPSNKLLVRSHRLLNIACRAARNQKWFRCWRYVDQAIPGFSMQGHGAVSSPLIGVFNHLYPQSRVA